MIVASIRSEPAFGFMVLALVIIFGPLIAQQLKLPGLLGLLIAGAVIGPNMLGVLDSFSGLEAIGDIGVLYLIFLAGLGLDRKTFDQHRDAALSFGLITATVPWIIGSIVASLAGYEAKTAVLIGSFWASFTLVSYGVVTRFGLTRKPSVAATVGASSITDTIGLVTLALVVATESGDSRGIVVIVEIALGLLAVAGYCLVILPRIARWFFSGLGQERELRFMMVLAGFTSAAVVAELVGIEPLIGAFFAGLGLNRLVPNESRLMARVDFFGNALFIPAFLVSVGLLVDPSVMTELSTVTLAGGLAFALVAGKAMAAWITGRIYKYQLAEIGLMFSLSTAQAAATLASTIIGLEIGLYGEDVVNAVMIVIVISLLVSSIGSDYFAPRIERDEVSERRLGETIVVPVIEEDALVEVMWLAGQVAEPDGGVIVPVGVAVVDEPESLGRTRAELDEVRDELGHLGLTGDPELRVARSVSNGISRFAAEQDASLVLLPAPDTGDFRQLMLGGTNDEIAASVDRPIAIADLARTGFDRVLVAVGAADVSPGTAAEISLAFYLAGQLAVSGGLELLFGPAGRDQLEEMGIDIPLNASELSDAGSTQAWVEEHTTDDDVVALSAQGDPSSALRRLRQPGRSLVVLSERQDARAYSPEGALGVTSTSY